jgi:hypothetical protein
MGEGVTQALPFYRLLLYDKTHEPLNLFCDRLLAWDNLGTMIYRNRKSRCAIAGIAALSPGASKPYHKNEV